MGQGPGCPCCTPSAAGPHVVGDRCHTEPWASMRQYECSPLDSPESLIPMSVVSRCAEGEVEWVGIVIPGPGGGELGHDCVMGVGFLLGAMKKF